MKKRFKFGIAATAAASMAMIAVGITGCASTIRESAEASNVTISIDSAAVSASAINLSPDFDARDAKEMRTAIAADKLAAKKAEEARVEAERVAAEEARIAANTRHIHVEIAGWQEEVDLCAGPVLFQPDGYTMVVEHDRCGGWDRIGTIQNGMTVNLSGLITGTYTVGEIITIPQINKLVDMKFVNTPVVYLQTCIPGTDRSVVLGLYHHA